MNLGRFLAASIAVWVVRVVVGWLFWGMYMAEEMRAATQPWAAAFREVVPAYILTDLLFAVIFVWLWSKVGGAFGEGAKAGATYGFVIGLLAGAVPVIFHYYSVTYIATGPFAQMLLVELVSGVLAGVAAAAIYKGTPARSVATA